MSDMSVSKSLVDATITEKPVYERPTLQVMSQDEVLQALQMSANEISAAGCWWGAC